MTTKKLSCILLIFLIGFGRVTLAQKVGPIKINQTNAAAYRDTLIKKILGTNSFPYTIQPDSIITNVQSLDLYSGMPYSPVMYPAGNLDSIDKLVVKIGDPADFPAPATIYLFHPHNSNGKLFIYHSGHCAGIATAEDIFANNNDLAPGFVIPALLEKGYTVLAVPMLNYQHTAAFGYYCGYNQHDQLFEDGHYQYPLSFFFTPLIASLNFLGRSNFSAIYMIGLSGGGWETSVYPAMDSSIICSFPVAGSWPDALRSYFNLNFDTEQGYPPVFVDFLDFHELYTLSCLAPARKVLQINNRYDPCCFFGPTAHIFYADSVANALKPSNGVFKFYLDETGTQHAITSRAMEVVFTFLQNETGDLLVKPADTITGGANYFYSIRNNFIVNNAASNFGLKYSLLKAPSWLSLDIIHGAIQGIVPPVSIIASPDTISFKVEDLKGRFIIYNYQLIKKRAAPFFFTKYDDPKTIYCLPAFAHSIQTVQQSAAPLFYFNNPSMEIIALSVENNSVIKINVNIPVMASDSIGYYGSFSSFALLYNNGMPIENFGLTKINIDAVSRNYAIAGMIRFNSDTKKFEYFNGTNWIEMN